MSELHPQPVPSDTTNLQPDGTVFPPVTPDPPPPPGYVSPLDGVLDEFPNDPLEAYLEVSVTDTERD